MRALFLFLLSFALPGIMLPVWAYAEALPSAGLAGLLCRGAINAAEAATRIPDAFLNAIGRVESGRRVSDTGGLAPWPWTVNAQGEGHYYASKEAAIAAVRQFQAAGIQSIDVGCLQVNLQWHKGAFTSLEEAFDPAANARFAAHLLMALFAETGSWPRAAAAYHSMTPAIGADYQKRVLAEWAVPEDAPGHQRHLAEVAVVEPAAPSPGGIWARPAIHPAAATIAAAWGTPAVTGFSHDLPTPRAAIAGMGRSLAAYRSVPVPLARGLIGRWKPS